MAWAAIFWRRRRCSFLRLNLCTLSQALPYWPLQAFPGTFATIPLRLAPPNEGDLLP